MDLIYRENLTFSQLRETLRTFLLAIPCQRYICSQAIVWVLRSAEYIPGITSLSSLQKYQCKTNNITIFHAVLSS